LALWQANHAVEQLESIGLKGEIVVIKTKGDEITDLGFDKMEGKGFFTKEIEEALLSKKIDIAIHSYKDLETNPPKGLVVAAVSVREDANDLLIIDKSSVDEKRVLGLKQGAVVGTSSARRKSQILAFRMDVELKDLRGNITTRIEKLRNGDYDAILMAAAGINRLELDLSDFHVEQLDCTEFIPAPAQGVLAYQIREDDKDLLEALGKLSNQEVEATSAIERKVLNLFDGGCQLPLGAYCQYDEDEELYKLWAARADSADKPPVVMYRESKHADSIAEKLVERLKTIKPTGIFISRNLRKDDYFENVLRANGYNVHGKSLIEIKRVPVTKNIDDLKFEWVFFSSKQAVVHFLKQAPEIEGVKYAVIGKPTAYALRQNGKSADFIGYSSDTKLTGKQFASTVGSANVLFPQARGSMRTIQQQFPNDKQVIDLVVYETISHDDFRVPNLEILLFTSPSNVQAFFKNHFLTKNQKVIAMGNATANELKRNSINRFSMPYGFNDMALAQAVFAV